jgi:hypothetical protein
MVHSGVHSSGLSTITNSPKKPGPTVKGLKKIPAPSKPTFSPDLTKTKSATTTAALSAANTDRLKRSQQVNECKQS